VTISDSCGSVTAFMNAAVFSKDLILLFLPKFGVLFLEGEIL
jgi:hypothetical protein